MLRSGPTPVIGRAGVDWLERLRERAAVLTLVAHKHQDAVSYPKILHCHRCSVPHEDGQLVFYRLNTSWQFICLDCVYQQVQHNFPDELPEPPNGLVVEVL
jgi:hypothetical protein